MGTDEDPGASPEQSAEYVKRSDLEDLVRSILNDHHDEDDDDGSGKADDPPPPPTLTLSDIERVMEEKVAKAIKELTAKRAARPSPPPKPPAASAEKPEPAPESPTKINFRERIWGSK